MAKSQRIIWIAVLAVALLSAYSQLRLSQIDERVRSIEHLSDNLSTRAAESVRAIEAEKQRVLTTLHGSVDSALASAAKTISDKQARAFEDRLRQLVADISKREAELATLKAEHDRALNGLPEQVDLDQLNEYYAGKWKKVSGYFGAVETFNTALGPITFQKSHFTFAYVPSSKRLAWVKIGKDNSTENSKLIKAWIAESERAKIRLGYTREYRRTKPADYGDYTEALYRKGDMYFKTFLQHQRVQGTYGRYSLQYTYYVETGSVARKKQYELEQYNKKLGS